MPPATGMGWAWLGAPVGLLPPAGGAVPWGGSHRDPLVLPPWWYMGAGGAGSGRALPAAYAVLNQHRALRSCPAGCGTAEVEARRAGLASAGCRHDLPGC